MLETLKIKNLVTFEKAEIGFNSGLNILSGETGAGKSIIIEAISLILRNRGNTDLIRSGEAEMQVEALFQIEKQLHIQARLLEFGFPNESNELIIKRILTKAGKGRIFINGELATLTVLQKVTDGLIDLCGQHEHQSLTKTATQTEFLDLFGNHEKTLNQYQEAFKTVKTMRNELIRLHELEKERIRKLDFIQFQIHELEELELELGEDQRLHDEKKLLQSAETRLQQIQSVLIKLEGDSDLNEGVLQSLKIIENFTKNLETLDPTLHSNFETVNRARIELEETTLEFSKYAQNIENDGNRLQWVTDRLGDLARIKKKYDGTIETALQTLQKLKKEHQTLLQIQEQVLGQEAQLKKQETELQKHAKTLHETRKKSSISLGKAISQELHELKMEDATLRIDCVWNDSSENWSELGPDQVQFLVQTNLGEEEKPISKIASGGELSRIMLATRRIISDRGGIGVYLFDEIDAGIGGQTAFVVGQKLKSVSKYHQVICITHVPQVASFADQLFSVKKQTKGNRTYTEINQLNLRDQKEEVARMLGGPKLTDKSLENAEELIRLAKTTKSGSVLKNQPSTR